MDIKLQPNITGTNVNLVKGATQADLTNVVNNAKTYRDEAQAFSILSEDKSIESSYSALNASVSATTAIDKANIATNKATEANNSAINASASEAVCIAKATIATDKADIATAQSVMATDKANEASVSANTATTQAGIATTKASEASTSASNALTSENNADTSEANALIYRNQAESFANSINPSDLVHISGTETITGNKTFSGTVSGLTKATVGLSNVDNTSDANKPISNAVQTALYLKADKANTLGGYGITDAYTKTSTDSLIDIHSKTAKTTLADADEFMTADSTSSFSLKKITWASIKNLISTTLNSFTATKLQTERAINNKLFNGTSAISIGFGTQQGAFSTNFTLSSSNINALLVCNGGLTITLPPINTLTSGDCFIIRNGELDPITLVLNGNSTDLKTLKITGGETLCIQSDGGSYYREVYKKHLPIYDFNGTIGTAYSYNTVYQADVDMTLIVNAYNLYMGGLHIAVGTTSSPAQNLCWAGDDIDSNTKYVTLSAVIPAGMYFKVQPFTGSVFEFVEIIGYRHS